MSKLAVEFEVENSRLLLLYIPRDDDSWVQRKFAKGEELVIKGTFHLRRDHCVSGFNAEKEPDDDFETSDPLRFVVAQRKGEYFVFDEEILPINGSLMMLVSSLYVMGTPLI